MKSVRLVEERPGDEYLLLDWNYSRHKRILTHSLTVNVYYPHVSFRIKPPKGRRRKSRDPNRRQCVLFDGIVWDLGIAFVQESFLAF